MDESPCRHLAKNDHIFQAKVMVDGGVEKKLDGGRKLFVPFPEDILERNAGKSMKNERSIPNLNRLSS